MISSKDNFENHLLPNGTEVIFYPDTHTYFVDGKELPSITSLLTKVYGNSYANVNPELLKRSADYGTKVHEELQNLIELRKEDDGAPLYSEYQEVENYFKFVEPIYKIQPIMTEKVVVLYDDNNKPYAAGRFDLLCNVDGHLTLADFKTTSTIHRQLVTAQLNLYLKAAKQSGYIDSKDDIKLGVIHLSGITSKFIPITKLGETFIKKFY